MADRYGLEIRSATAADAAGVADLLAGIGRPVAPTDLAARIEAVRAAAGAVLIALEWGPPSGLVALCWRPDILSPAPVAEMTALVVRPDARRRGIGRLLLKAAAQAARTAGCARLQVTAPPGHADLEGFCRAAGFTGIGSGFERGLRKRA